MFRVSNMKTKWYKRLKISNNEMEKYFEGLQNETCLREVIDQTEWNLGMIDLINK